jgi:Flp pilus assembly protein TadG
MYRWTSSIAPKLRSALHDRRGVAALAFAVAGTALIGAVGFAVDVGVFLSAHQALQANTNAAVLDAAYQWDQTDSTQSAAVSAAQAWNAAHPVPFVSGITANASAVCINQTSGLPTCGTVNGATVNNAVALTQTGTVPTYFLSVLGINSWTVKATAAAAKAGGPTKAMNIMFVLDTTNSMGTTTDDTGCTVPNISSPTKVQCAMYGVQLILKQLNPTIDQVGLMVFPGMSSTWTPSCSTSPSIEPYGTTGIVYQVIHNALDTDYATVTGTLNDSSLLVKAVGDNSNKLSGCLKAPGGEGTFYAQAISAAQSALQTEGSSTAQNVIILLSDGEANQVPGDGKMDVTYALNNACSPSTVCSPGHQVQQCSQAVANGQSATTAGTWVYAIAYDAGTVTGATIPYGGASGTGCNAIYPGDNIAANGSISKSSTTITVQNLSNYPWVANLGGGATCSGCNVYDSTQGVQIGTISSWTGTTITLKAKASNAGKGTSDTLLIQSGSPSRTYDSPTRTSVSQWTPCSTLQNMASDSTKFWSSSSTAGSCTSVNPYTNVATSFQQAGYTLSQPRLVLQ